MIAIVVLVGCSNGPNANNYRGIVKIRVSCSDLHDRCVSNGHNVEVCEKCRAECAIEADHLWPSIVHMSRWRPIVRTRTGDCPNPTHGRTDG